MNTTKSKTSSSFSLDIALYIENRNGIYVFLCDNYVSAKDLYKNISFFSSKKIFFCEEIIPVSLLYDLKHDNDAVLILTPLSFFSKVPEPGSLLNSFIHIKKGLDISRENLIRTLISYGYEKTTQIENRHNAFVQ